MSKIVYITVKIPFGAQETFILEEMLSIKRLGTELIVVPRDFSTDLFHNSAKVLLENTISLPWLDAKIALHFLKFAFSRPITFLSIVREITVETGGLKTGLKNLIVLPKAVYLSNILASYGVTHIHAHWASTTSTMAYIISKLTGIPWSFTAHRGDIPDNNMLRSKCASASFVRAIDDKGMAEILEVVKDKSLAKKILVLHMGVELPELARRSPRKSSQFTFLCPANFVEKKGHAYLIQTCGILSKMGVDYRCLLAGDGELEPSIKAMVSSCGLVDRVDFMGRVKHERLMELYKNRDVDAVVLPSIHTEDGEREGIPVALMEAMSYGIPVISTSTGGIVELIGDGGGVVVPEKDACAIADGIVKLIKDASYYNFISERGRKKIEEDFNSTLVSRKLLNLFSRE